MLSFQKRKLACSIAVAVSFNAIPNAFSQSTELTAEVLTEEIIVTGSFRESLKNALNIKRNGAESIDSIIAEDIGDFPDNNLAEALQRIPGVNIERQGGEGKTISVRGLSSDFSRVRLNGMEAIATGLENRSRSFDFNIFASELFSRIDVKKTQNAETDEGSLGATVELYTARPLDSDGNTFVLNFSEGYNDLSGNMDPRISGLMNLQNSDGTLGWSLSGAYSQRTLVQQGHNSGRWEANKNTNDDHWANSTALTEDTNSAFHPRYPRQIDRSLDLERLGITNTVQWEINDGTSITFDMLNASFTNQQSEFTLTPISLSRTDINGRADTTVGDHSYVADNNTLVYAKLTGVDIRSENSFINAETAFNQYSLSFEHEFTRTFRMNALIGASDSTTEVDERIISLEAVNQDFTYDYRNNEFNPMLSYGFNLTEPNNWKIAELRDRPATTENTYAVGQVDFIWDLPAIFTAKAGVSVKQFTFDNFSARRDRAVLSGDGTSVDVPDGCGLTFDDLNVTSAMGSNFIPSNNRNEYFLPNIDAISEHTQFLSNDTCFPLSARAGDDKGVEETDTGAYAQLDFEKEIGDTRLKGNIGLRYVSTQQDTRGVFIVSDESTGSEVRSEVSPSRTYTDTLPSINLSFEPLNEVFLRASWSKVMSRPTLANVAPSRSLDGFNRTYTVGNSDLEPFRATAADLSVEWYFDSEALVSFAYFTKDIESFNASFSQSVDWVQFNLPDSVLDNVPATPNDTFTYKTTVNGEGGTLNGWELQFQTPIMFGPEWLRDFGVKCNYTAIESDVNIGVGNPVSARLNGQSDTSLNGTIWYENYAGFQGRISYTYRSDYQTRLTSRLGADYGTDNTDDVSVVDASLSYILNEHFKFSLDMLNLTDEPETSLLGTGELLDTSLASGRQFYLGVQFSF